MNLTKKFSITLKVKLYPKVNFEKENHATLKEINLNFNTLKSNFSLT